MLKRSISAYILLASIILAITTIIVLYYLPKYKTTQSNIQINASTSPNDTLAAPVESDSVRSSPTHTTIFPSSSLLPLHVSDSKALALYDQGLTLYYQRQYPEALIFFNRACLYSASP